MKAARFILFILVAIGMIWLIFILLSKAFSTSSSTTPTTQTQLVSYADTNAVTTMFIDGPVVANQVHEALRITVSRSQAKVELINGYEGEVVRQETFSSNSTAYAAFLKALDKALFDNPVAASVSTDERGYCPLRNRFVYTLDTGSKQVIRAWTSSCGIGNYTGNRQLTRTLFINQIPRTILNDVLRGTKISLS